MGVLGIVPDAVSARASVWSSIGLKMYCMGDAKSLLFLIFLGIGWHHICNFRILLKYNMVCFCPDSIALQTIFCETRSTWSPEKFLSLLDLS